MKLNEFRWCEFSAHQPHLIASEKFNQFSLIVINWINRTKSFSRDEFSPASTLFWVCRVVLVVVFRGYFLMKTEQFVFRLFGAGLKRKTFHSQRKHGAFSPKACRRGGGTDRNMKDPFSNFHHTSNYLLRTNWITFSMSIFTFIWNFDKLLMRAKMEKKDKSEHFPGKNEIASRSIFTGITRKFFVP